MISAEKSIGLKCAFKSYGNILENTRMGEKKSKVIFMQ
jgi:hypothetical protein